MHTYIICTASLHFHMLTICRSTAQLVSIKVQRVFFFSVLRSSRTLYICASFCRANFKVKNHDKTISEPQLFLFHSSFNQIHYVVHCLSCYRWLTTIPHYITVIYWYINIRQPRIYYTRNYISAAVKLNAIKYRARDTENI